MPKKSQAETTNEDLLAYLRRRAPNGASTQQVADFASTSYTKVKVRLEAMMSAGQVRLRSSWWHAEG
jgi:hypothetical protein